MKRRTQGDSSGRDADPHVGSIVHFIAVDDQRRRCMAAIVVDITEAGKSLHVFGYYGNHSFREGVRHGRRHAHETGTWHWPGRDCASAGEVAVFHEKLEAIESDDDD
jgi:hypothetical protein